MRDTVIFRCNASPKVGSGHVMRCLTLATALAKRGEVRPVFATDDGGTDVIAKFGALPFDVVRVAPTSSETERILTIADREGAKYVIWDSYQMTQDEEVEIAKRIPLMIFDDTHLLPWYTCDSILNQNIYGDRMDYRKNTETSVLAGLKYTMLRDSFQAYAAKEKGIADKATRLLITFGGADLHNDSARVLEWLKLFPERLHITVVLGGQFLYLDALEKMLESDYPHHVSLRSNVTNMAELMWDTDIALTASGSTMYELAFLGVPSCSVVMADNQLQVAESFVRSGATCYLGRREQLNGELLRRELSALIHSASSRERMSQLGRQLVDGQGVNRVAEYIEERVKGR